MLHRRLSVSLVWAFVTVTAGAQGTSNYLPRWTADGSQVIYSARRNNKWRIMAVDASTRMVRALTSGEYNDNSADPSPVGRRVAFVSDRDGDKEIYVMEDDGSAVTRITERHGRDLDPRWSPQGEEIAYRAENAGRMEIWVTNATGGQGRKLVGAPYYVNSRLAWSVDGKKILFFATDDGRDANSSNHWRLYEVDVTTGVLNPLDTWRRDGNVNVSRDGMRLIVDGHKKGKWDSEDGDWELWIIDTRSKSRRNLTRNSGRNDWGGAFSPEGSTVAYSSGRDDQYDIYLLDMEGSEPRRLTFDVERAN